VARAYNSYTLNLLVQITSRLKRLLFTEDLKSHMGVWEKEYLISGTETSLRVRISSYDVNLTLKGQKKKVIYSSMLPTFWNSTVTVEVSQDSPLVRQSSSCNDEYWRKDTYEKNQSSRTKACSNASHFVNHKCNMDWTEPEPKPTGYEPYAIASLKPQTKLLEVGPRSKRLKTALLVFQ